MGNCRSNEEISKRIYDIDSGVNQTRIKLGNNKQPILERLFWLNNIEILHITLFNIVQEEEFLLMKKLLSRNLRIKTFILELDLNQVCDDIFEGLKQNKGITLLFFSSLKYIEETNPDVIRHLVDIFKTNKTITSLVLSFKTSENDVFEALNNCITTHLFKLLSFNIRTNLAQEQILYRNISRTKFLEELSIETINTVACAQLMDEIRQHGYIKILCISRIRGDVSILENHIIQMIEMTQTLVKLYIPDYAIHPNLLCRPLTLNYSLTDIKLITSLSEFVQDHIYEKLLDVNKHIVPADDMYGRSIPKEVHMLICRYLKEAIIKKAS